MNPVVHFEMPYEDEDRVTTFYANVFGWQMQKLGKEMGGYILANTGNQDVKSDAPRGVIDGGFFPTKSDWPAQYPSVVIAVENIKQTMKNIEEAGGKILGDPKEIPGVGLYVSFNDTEANRVSLLQPSPM
jgi:predicted enzyme related to lactoylglutathione lyase